MNGGFQGPSATEDLARTPKASHWGDSRGGKETSGQLCSRLAPGSERPASRYRKNFGLHRRKHGQPCRRNSDGWYCRLQHLESDSCLLRRHHDRVVRFLYFWQPCRRLVPDILSHRKPDVCLHRVPGDVRCGIYRAALWRPLFRSDRGLGGAQVCIPCDALDYGRSDSINRNVAYLQDRGMVRADRTLGHSHLTGPGARRRVWGCNRVRGRTRSGPQARVLYELHSDYCHLGLFHFAGRRSDHAVFDEPGGLPEIRLAHPVPYFYLHAGDLALYPTEDEGITHLLADQGGGDDLGAAAERCLRKMGQFEARDDFSLRRHGGARCRVVL